MPPHVVGVVKKKKKIVLSEIYLENRRNLYFAAEKLASR